MLADLVICFLLGVRKNLVLGVGALFAEPGEEFAECESEPDVLKRTTLLGRGRVGGLTEPEWLNPGTLTFHTGLPLLCTLGETGLAGEPFTLGSLSPHPAPKHLLTDLSTPRGSSEPSPGSKSWSAMALDKRSIWGFISCTAISSCQLQRLTGSAAHGPSVHAGSAATSHNNRNREDDVSQGELHFEREVTGRLIRNRGDAYEYRRGSFLRQESLLY